MYDNLVMIEEPVLLIGCARSGTTLLYNILSEVPLLWSIGHESKRIIEQYHSPSFKDWEFGSLSAADLTEESRAYIQSRFLAEAAPGTYWRRVNTLRRVINRSEFYRAVKRRGRTLESASSVSNAIPGAGLELFRSLVRAYNRIRIPRASIRLLEKTPENCLRLPFLTKLFPDARVIYLPRDGRANVHSLMEGWRQPHLFPGYITPIPVTSPGQNRGRWAFTLIPGWRALVDEPLEVICAHQWVKCNEEVCEYEASPEARPILTIRYEDLVTDTATSLERIAEFLGLSTADIPSFGRELPEVNAVSSPDMNKWQLEREAIERVIPILAPTMAKLGYSI